MATPGTFVSGNGLSGCRLGICEPMLTVQQFGKQRKSLGIAIFTKRGGPAERLLGTLAVTQPKLSNAHFGVGFVVGRELLNCSLKLCDRTTIVRARPG